MDKKNFFTIPELAKYLGISRIAMYKKVKSGEIKAVKIGRTYAISKVEFESIIGKALTKRQKKTIEAGVRKTIKDYGKVLQLLGQGQDEDYYFG